MENSTVRGLEGLGLLLTAATTAKNTKDIIDIKKDNAKEKIKVRKEGVICLLATTIVGSLLLKNKIDEQMKANTEEMMQHITKLTGVACKYTEDNKALSKRVDRHESALDKYGIVRRY